LLTSNDKKKQQCSSIVEGIQLREPSSISPSA